MIKRSVLFLIVLIGMAALNTGFFNEKVDLNVVKQPSIVAIMGNQDEDTIVKLQQELTELQKKTGTDAKQQAVSLKLQQLVDKETVQTYDKAFITKLMEIFKDRRAMVNDGDIMKPKSGMIYMFQFGYNVNLKQDSSDDMVNNLKAGYIPDLYIFPNNLMLMPFYNKDSGSLVSTVELRLDDEDMKYLSDFYNAKIKAKH